MKNNNYWLWMLAGMLFIVISLPLILQKIPPNRLYGFKVKKTLSNNRIWYEANRIAGYDLLLVGVVTVCTTLITARIAQSSPGIAVDWINSLIFFLSLGVAVIHSFWSLSRL